MSRRGVRSGRRATTGFSMGPIRGMLAYFDPVNAITSSGNVTSWPQSGGSIASSPAGSTGQYPTIVTANGRQFVRFASASSQFLRETPSALAAALGGVTPYTLYCAIGRTDPTSGQNSTICGWAQPSGNNYVAHLTLGPLRDQYSRASAGGGATNSITAGAVWTQALCAFASVFTGSSFTSYINNAVIQAAANSQDIGPATIFDIGRYVVASGVVGGYLTGDVGRLLFYQGAHSPTQIERMTMWLRNYYGF